MGKCHRKKYMRNDYMHHYVIIHMYIRIVTMNAFI